MPRTCPWEVSDELWERVQPLIPPVPLHTNGAAHGRLTDKPLKQWFMSCEQAFIGGAATGANRHDMKVLCATLEGMVINRPGDAGPSGSEPCALETVCDEEKEAVCAMLMQSPKQKHSQLS